MSNQDIAGQTLKAKCIWKRRHSSRLLRMIAKHDIEAKSVDPD